MNGIAIRFEELPWRESRPGARSKRLETPSAVLRLLELEPGYFDETWCDQGHHGLVLEGSMEVETESGTEAAPIANTRYVGSWAGSH